MRIAIYSRKSKITDTGDSINNQITMCKNYANIHFPNSTFTIYEDEGFSGGNIHRPMFKQLLNNIKDKKFDVLICYRLDRISRNVADFSTTLDLLQDNKVDFVSIKENFDTSTPMGRAMIYISSVFAQLERDTIAERISDNLLELARTGSGRYLGGVAPFGFYKLRKDNFEGKSYSVLVVCPTESEKVKHIFDMYVELKSLRKLESYLILNNIKTRNNSNFNTHKLGILLRRPNYAYADEAMYTYFKNLGTQISNSKIEFDGKNGISVFGRSGEGRGEISKLNSYDKWVIGVGDHDGIIESSKWLTVQKILELRKNNTIKLTQSSYGLVNGLLKCKLCGDYMRPTSVRNKGSYFYYVCITKEKSRKSKCFIQNIRGDVLDKNILIELNNNLEDLQHKFNYMKNKQSIIKQESSQKINYKNKLQNEINENKKIIDNLINKISINTSCSIEKHIAFKIEKLDKRNSEIEKELSRPDHFIDLSYSNVDLIEEVRKIYTSDYFSNNTKYVKNILKTIINSIYWDGKNIYINFFAK